MSKGIGTVSEWQTALDEAERGDPGKSAPEIAAELGMNVYTAHSWLGRLVKQGKAIKGYACRGGLRRVAVYQIKKGKKK